MTASLPACFDVVSVFVGLESGEVRQYSIIVTDTCQILITTMFHEWKKNGHAIHKVNVHANTASIVC